jgi:heptosyltransferase-2
LSRTTPGRRIVRAPNHLGDVVAALPAIVADGSDVLVVRWLAPILEMAGGSGEVLPFDRGFRGFARAARELRRRRYGDGVLLSPAFSAAWLMRCGGVARVRGTATDGRTLLLSERIEPETLRPHHRINAYRLLLGQGATPEPRGHRLLLGEELRERWRAEIGPRRPVVGLFPGANAPARRWPVERFAEVGAALASRGARVVVLGGRSEAPLAARVARGVAGALEVAGRTDLGDLAALL